MSSVVAPVDLAVVIALDEEFDVFLRLLGEEPEKERDDEHGGYYYLTKLATEDGGYTCVIRFVGEKGPSEALKATDRLIERWKPTTVVVLGICAALRDDLKLGDVVIAKQVDGYLQEVKAVPSKRGGFVFKHRGEVYRSDHIYLEEVKHLRHVHKSEFKEWLASMKCAMQKIPKKRSKRLSEEGLLGDEPSVERVHLASGPVLSAAKDFAEWLHGRDDSIKALEMETVGVVSSAQSRSAPVRFLAVRGVSDLGDERKKVFDAIGGGVIREYAMTAATSYFQLLVRLGIFARLAPKSANAVKPTSKSRDRETSFVKRPVDGRGGPPRTQSRTPKRPSAVLGRRKVATTRGPKGSDQTSSDDVRAEFDGLVRNAKQVLTDVGRVGTRALFSELCGDSWLPSQEAIDEYGDRIRKAQEDGYIADAWGDDGLAPNHEHPKIRKARKALHTLQKFMDSDAFAEVAGEIEDEDEIIVKITNREFFDRYLTKMSLIA
jgi:nucleoside phosphorylase